MSIAPIVPWSTAPALVRSGPCHIDPSRPSPPGPCASSAAARTASARDVLREFVRLAGGDGARIAVVATASSLGPRSSTSYDAVFRRWAPAESSGCARETRDEADDPRARRPARRRRRGLHDRGQPAQALPVIAGTRFGDAVRAAYERGALVGGTSAGASAVSEHMVAFGDEGDTPRQG